MFISNYKRNNRGGKKTFGLLTILEDLSNVHVKVYLSQYGLLKRVKKIPKVREKGVNTP